MSKDELCMMTRAPASSRIDSLLQHLLTSCRIDVTYELREGSPGDGVQISVEFSGPDESLLAARNGELLHALEGVAIAILRLEPEQHDQISFDADGYKQRRAQQMQRAAEVAVAAVKRSGRPYTFPPMNSRERRMLHLELTSSGLRTASTGEASRRCVVLYPAQQLESDRPTASGEGRAKIIRSAFRPR